MIGLGHSCREWDSECLGVIKFGGSAMITAVAGINLSITNVPARIEENTAITFPPLIPDINEDTSPPTAGF